MIRRATGWSCWANELSRERGLQLHRERQGAEAGAIANRPPPNQAELEAQRQAAGAEQQAREAAAPYRVLGWDAPRRRIWFQHRETAQISAINPGPSFERRLPLGPLAHWEATYPADRRAGGGPQPGR